MVDTAGTGGPPIDYVLGIVMPDEPDTMQQPKVLDVVALLVPKSDAGLTRGQVGTVVEALDAWTVMVEFCDDEGRPYAIIPCSREELLMLHYVPRAA